MDKQSVIERNLQQSIALKQQLLADKTLTVSVTRIADRVIDCFTKGGKVLFCGNGGSAADAQHLAAEFSGRYYSDRPALHADVLHGNISYLTSVANDYSYDVVYSRLIRAMGEAGDILIGLSTSGSSPNIVKALKTARQLSMTTVGFTGQDGGKMKAFCDYTIEIPSQDTPRIQECHMLLGHAICEMVEKNLFPDA